MKSTNYFWHLIFVHPVGLGAKWPQIFTEWLYQIDGKLMAKTCPVWWKFEDLQLWSPISYIDILYNFGSLFGLLPQLFVWTSLGSGLEKIINENLEAPSLIDMILSSEIYIPIFGFIILILLGVLTKRLYFKK